MENGKWRRRAARRAPRVTHVAITSIVSFVDFYLPIMNSRTIHIKNIFSWEVKIHVVTMTKLESAAKKKGDRDRGRWPPEREETYVHYFF